MTTTPALQGSGSDTTTVTPGPGQGVATVAAPGGVADGDVIVVFGAGVMYHSGVGPGSANGQQALTQIEPTVIGPKRSFASCNDDFVSGGPTFIWGHIAQCVVIQDAGSHPANYTYTIGDPALGSSTEGYCCVHYQHWRGAGSPDYQLARVTQCPGDELPAFTGLAGDLYIAGYTKAFLSGAIGTLSGYTSRFSYVPGGLNFATRVVSDPDNPDDEQWSPQGTNDSRGVFGFRVYEDTTPALTIGPVGPAGTPGGLAPTTTLDIP